MRARTDRQPLQEYLPDGQPCDECDRTDTDYLAQTQGGFTICQHCLEEELDGLLVELQSQDMQFTDGGRLYVAKASCYRRDRSQPFVDFGVAEGLREACDDAKQRALSNAFPPIPCRHNDTAPVVVQYVEPVLPPDEPKKSKVIEQLQSATYPAADFTQSAGETVEIDRPVDGAAPPVPPPGESVKESTPHSRWHRTMGGLPYALNSNEQRIILGVESRAEAAKNPEWMDLVRNELSKCTADQISLIVDLCNAFTMDMLKDAWMALDPSMHQWLKTAKDHLKKKLDPEPIADPDEVLKHDKCKGCNADILWGKTSRGKDVPVDMPRRRAVEPVEGSHEKPQKRYVIRGERKMQLVNTWDYRADAASCVCYMPHHATCPNAGQYRKP